MNINELLEPNAKKAVFTFGRFNPPTKGHARLMDVVKNASSGADHYVFTGRTNDPKKNPLQYKDKITFLRAMFPHMNIMDNPQIRTPWEALEELGKQYDEIVMVVGSDRKDDFESQMRPYLKDFGIDKFSIVSSGERDADATDVSGVSASKARALAKAGDFKSFSGTIDGGEKLKQQLYTKVRQGMGIMEMANKPKMPKRPEIKSRDPNWRDMEAIRKSGAAGSHKDKKALDKRGYQKHKGKSIDMDEAPKGKPIAYVDMDGVLANFFAEYANLAGVTTGNYKDIPPAKTDPTLDKMVGTDFFNRLPKFPTTDKLIQLVTKEFGSYKILSSPLRGDHENSKQQKIKWIQRELAIQPDEIIVVGRKDSYAVQADGTPNILIDDRGKNIEGWRSRGGYGIKYQADEDPLSKVVDGIKEFKEKNNLTEYGGRVVKGINTTHDVGVDAIKKQSAKFGFKVTKDGVPPIMAPKNLRRVKRMQEALIKINGSNKNLTLQQQIDLQEIKKGISQMVKEAKKKRSNPAEVPYQNDGGEMSLLTHPGTEMFQKMKATSKPGTEDWFKTWRTLSYLTKGRKNHYMLPVKEQLERLLIEYGVIQEASGFSPKNPETFKPTFTYTDNGNEYKWVDHKLGVNSFPPNQDVYETAEDMANAIAEVEKSLGQPITFVKSKTIRDLTKGVKGAFGYMKFQNLKNPNDVVYVGAFGNKKPSVNLYQEDVEAAGLVVGTKAQTNRSANLKPQAIGIADSKAKNITAIVNLIKKFDKEQNLNGMLSNAMDSALKGESIVFPGGKAVANAIQNNFCEILGPVVLLQHLTNKQQQIDITGSSGDAITKSIEKILQGESLAGTAVWPSGETEPLVDSFLLGPGKIRYGISSKGKKGAKATVTNIYSAMQKSPPEVVEKYSKAKEILELMVNTPKPKSVEQPILVAQALKIINEAQGNLVREIYKNKSNYIFPMPIIKGGRYTEQDFEQHRKTVPEQLKSIYDLYKYTPGANLGNLLLANLAKKSAQLINESPNVKFSDATKAFLDSADFVQATSFVKVSGEDAVYDKLIITYPPVFEGTIEVSGAAWDAQSRAEAFKFSIPYK